LFNGYLLEQLTYPFPLLRNNSNTWGLRHPFEITVQPGKSHAGDELTTFTTQLQELFVPFGATNVCQADGAMSSKQSPQRLMRISFDNWDNVLKAMATPYALAIDGKELDCDLSCSTEQQDELSRMQDLQGSKLCVPDFKRMRKCLQATGIEHVLKREKDGWLAERTWEDILSGGEQQRLCLARVLYHGPVFALLDECTSMVAADAEEELYKRCMKDWGITPITITQRMFMPDLYKQELRLGTPTAKGWEVS